MHLSKVGYCALVVLLGASALNSSAQVSEGLGDPRTNSVLLGILKAFGEYGRKLAVAKIKFTCDEIIDEEIFSSRPGQGRIISSRGGPRQPDNVLNKYRYQYHLILNEGEVSAKRFLGESEDPARQLQRDQIKPAWLKDEYLILRPILFLSEEAQEAYSYRLLGKESLQGEKCIVVGVTPKAGKEQRNIQAKIWAQSDTLLPLKVEWSGAFPVAEKMDLRIQGGESATPSSSIALELFFEEDGIRFPTRYVVRESYIMPGKIFLRSKTDIRYSNYSITPLTNESADD